MNTENFRQLIRRVLKEEVEKKSVTGEKIFNRVPEVVHGEDLKKITPHERDSKTKEELLDDMATLVKGINKDYTVVWDDHDDISISARDLFRIRIIPKWENSYAIEAFTRNEDRIYITGQNWEQVKEFVKVNLKDDETAVGKAAKKVEKNREDQSQSPDKGLNQKDKPKTLPLTNEPVKTSKNKDKDFTEEAPNDDDLPEKPMREPKDQKKQIDHKVNEPVKLRKRKPDTKLTVKQS